MPEIEAALREFVRLRANSLCEYCHISERFTLAEHEIDHVIAVRHGGETVPGNLALCCTICNRFKGSSETGELTPLFHPRVDRWSDHFDLRDGEILAVTARRRVTLRLLRMNRPVRIQERRLVQR